MTDNYKITNEDCLIGLKEIKDDSINLVVADPPFGIDEGTFGKHYKRKDNVIDGYVHAPENYEDWSYQWIKECKRIIKNTGTIYIISGWSKLGEILSAIKKNDLHTINHVIWRFNFGVFTQKKYVSSHYHILVLGKKKKGQTFNTYCRFGPQEKNEKKQSLLNIDMEDVWYINKEFAPDQMKNSNKLPEALLEKIILYASNQGDIVLDPFLGNFTTAKVALNLGRKAWGFELNKESFNHFMPIISEIEFGKGLETLKKVKIIKPKKQGKKITDEDKLGIFKDYEDLVTKKKNKKDVTEFLQKKYERGKFSIKNILDKQVILKNEMFKQYKKDKTTTNDTYLKDEGLLLAKLFETYLTISNTDDNKEIKKITNYPTHEIKNIRKNIL